MRCMDVLPDPVGEQSEDNPAQDDRAEAWPSRIDHVMQPGHGLDGLMQLFLVQFIGLQTGFSVMSMNSLLT